MNIKLKIFLALACCIATSGCSLAKYGINYTQTQEPRFAKLNVSHTNGSSGNEIKVLSYNIRFAQKINEAIELLGNNPDLVEADVLLLQEMDELGAETIAKELGYNFVYYPAVFHPIPRQNFGNAILSKWPIIGDSKIILSDKNEKKLQRIAASATIDVNGKEVMVFSVHMRISVKPFLRSIQISRIINSIPENIQHCIVAGDFNTFSKVGHYAVMNPLKKNGFELATQELDWTYRHWYTANRKFSLDHIYTKGFTTVAVGKVNNRAASDHIPIWVNLIF